MEQGRRTQAPAQRRNPFNGYGKAVRETEQFFRDVVFGGGEEDGPDATKSTKRDSRAYLHQVLPGLIGDRARKHVGSAEWNKRGMKDNVRFGANKCNKFDADVIGECEIPLVHAHEDALGRKPPLAGDWADTKREIRGWRVLGDGEGPQSGDVVAIARQGPDYTGHVGIVSGQGKTTSATSDEIVENDWGFRPEHKGRAVFRRNVGDDQSGGR